MYSSALVAESKPKEVKTEGNQTVESAQIASSGRRADGLYQHVAEARPIG